MDKITTLFNKLNRLNKELEIMEVEEELSIAEDEEIELMNDSNNLSADEQKLLERIFKLNKSRESLKENQNINTVDKEQRLYALTIQIKELLKEL